MKPAVSRINARIAAYRTPAGTTVTQLPADDLKDQQVTIRLHPFLLYRLEILARHARMSRSQLMLEILQDGAEEVLAGMEKVIRDEIDAEVVERLQQQKA